MSLLTDSLGRNLPGASLLRAVAFKAQRRMSVYLEGAGDKELSSFAEELEAVSHYRVEVKDTSHWREVDFLRESLVHLGMDVSLETADGAYVFDASPERWEDVKEEYTRWGRGSVRGVLLIKATAEEEVVDHLQEEPMSLQEPHLAPAPLAGAQESSEEEDVAERIRREVEALLLSHEEVPEKPKKRRSSSKIIGGVAPRTASIVEALEQGPQKGLIVQGELIHLEMRRTKNDRFLYTGTLYDGSGSLPFTLFAPQRETGFLEETFKVGYYYRMRGELSYSEYDRCMTLMLQKIEEVEAPTIPGDESSVKRVELSALTNMSEVDGVVDVEELLKRAVHYEMEAIAITDRMNVLSYPKLSALADALPIRVLYGMEGVLYDDETLPFPVGDEISFGGTFVAIDFETTGLRADRDEIIEIGAVRIHNFEIVDTFSTLVRPKRQISSFTTELTRITQAMLDSAPRIEEVIDELMKFIADAPIVAHNSAFDGAFLREALARVNLPFAHPLIDTLKLSHLSHPTLRTHGLKRMAKELKIKQNEHHRALDDALVCAKIFLSLLLRFQSEGVTSFSQLNRRADDAFYLSSSRKHTFTLLAAKEGSLRVLYELLSEANLRHVDHRGPAIPKSSLKKWKEFFLLGSGDGAGELFEMIYLSSSPQELRGIAALYDFLELQPPAQHMALLETGRLHKEEEIFEIQERIVALASEMDLPVVATTHSRYLDSEDFLYRNIVREGQKRGYTLESRPGYTFLRTDEMLHAFAHLGEEKAKEIVIDNPVAIAASIPKLQPLKKGKYPPNIDHSDEMLRELCMEKATSIYGHPLPDPVRERLEGELLSIIGNGYAVLYIAAHKLVEKSAEMGYIVGSRGSVGSSFAATMAGITEVNPLPAHYACASCAHFEFNEDPEVENGFDMPQRRCPHCQVIMYQDGFNIPFESFMGFEGKKEPDIDLNFAPAIQLQMQQYTGELFGKDYVFKGGTVSAVKDKTAYGYTKTYFENRGRELPEAEIARISKRLEGIRRSTGQHPAGIITVPKGVSIYEFTPLQYPAHNVASGVVTTHFDYDALKGCLMKLDILGHDVPTLFYDLEELTGISPETISLRDKEVLALFNGVEALGLKDTRWSLGKGTLGVPEFGTSFTRGILDEVSIEGIEDLVRVSGLSHGRNVWAGNAQDLVREGTVDFKHVIATREQIMIYGQQKGLSRALSFDIMRKVKDGEELSEEDVSAMKDAGVPQWYIDSCNKMGYMFPKAHAVAYVLNGFRVAWFKLYHPAAFYAAYFSTKVDTFDTSRMCRGIEATLEELRAPKEEMRGKDKESDARALMEVVYEMYARGFDFAPPGLYTSHANKFLLQGERILPPLRAIPGVGENAALAIVHEREKGKFLSVEDLLVRAKLNKVAVEALRSHGVLDGLSETNQLDLFGYLNI